MKSNMRSDIIMQQNDFPVFSPINNLFCSISSAKFIYSIDYNSAVSSGWRSLKQHSFMFHQKCTEGDMNTFLTWILDFIIDDCLDSWWMCTFRIVHNFSSSVIIFYKKNSYIIWQRNACFEIAGNAVFGEFMGYAIMFPSVSNI